MTVAFHNNTSRNSTRAILDRIVKNLEGSVGSTNETIVATVKRIVDVHNSLSGVREPIKRRADAEQRNAQWLEAETSKAFGSKFQELARIRLDIEKTKSALLASKPTLPQMDKSDLFSVMETIALAQRVAASKNRTDLSPAEKLAALRAPAIAKIPDSVVSRWTNEVINAANPERAEVYARDIESVRQAESACKLALHSFQGELPPGSWQSFEREHLAPIRDELEKEKKKQDAQRAADAVDAAKDALRKAELEQHRHDMDLLKTL